MSTVISAMIPPCLTLVTVPASWLRVLSFMCLPSGLGAALVRLLRLRPDAREEAVGEHLRLPSLAHDLRDELLRVRLVGAVRDDADAVLHLGLCPGGHLDHFHLAGHGLGIGRVDEAGVGLTECDLGENL